MAEKHWDPWCERPSGLVVPTRIDPTGVHGPTRGQAAGPKFRQTSPGRYVPSTAPEVVEQRILEQAGRLPGYGAVTAWASLRWRGARFFEGRGADGSICPVPLLGRKLRPDPRVAVSQEQLAPSEFAHVDGIPCTTVQRALFDEVRRRSWREAVVAIDMTAAAGLISVKLFAEYVVERSAWTGVPFVRRVLALAIDKSRSPQETRMRLVWILDADLPPPLCNQAVFDLDGNLLGIPDFFDPVAGCVGEYDGVDHKDGRRHQRDVAREERYRDHGLEYFEVVGGDLLNRPMVVTRMRNARSRAKFLPPESCAWTLRPPPSYHRPETLDDRLARLGLADSLRRT
jgi:hypothetical protein